MTVLGGGGGENYLIAHIHRRFRHAHHETKVWLSSLGSQGRRREDEGTILNCLKVQNKGGGVSSTHQSTQNHPVFKQGPEESGWTPALLYLWYVLFIKLAFFGFCREEDEFDDSDKSNDGGSINENNANGSQSASLGNQNHI